MKLATFKKIAAEVAALEKSDVKFDIGIIGDNDYEPDPVVTFNPKKFEVSTLKQLAEVQAILGTEIALHQYGNKVEIKGLKPTPCIKPIFDLIADIKAKPLEK